MKSNVGNLVTTSLHLQLAVENDDAVVLFENRRMEDFREKPSASAPFELDRFVTAQADCFEQALSEIRAGRKQSHWMWFIFPQFDGLGFSSMSRLYAIKSIAEAEAYLRHPVLGPRLDECCEAAINCQGRSASEIFGSPDDMKLRSCATLFARVSPRDSLFERILDQFFEGVRDEKSLRLIAESQKKI